MDFELLLEAERRGILPPDKAELLAEARRRGLVDGAAPTSAPEPKRTMWDRVVDNVVGRDDGVMSFGEQLGTALNMGGESLTAGLVGDEAAARADAMIGRGSYDERLAKYRGDERQLWQENPVGAAAYTLAPALIPGSAGGKAVAATPTLAGKMVTSGILGALGGGTYGFMEGEGGFENRKSSAATGATVGGAVGLATPGISRIAEEIGKGVNRAGARRAAIASAPGLDDLYGRAEDAYTRADRSAPIPRAAFANAAEDVANRTRDVGRDPLLTPRAQRVTDLVMEEANLDKGANIGFRDIERLRRLAQSPAGLATDRAEQKVGGTIISAIDDFMDTSPDMGPAAKEARALWSRLRQSELLDDAMKRASLAASGFENGLRNEFRTILKSAKARGLSPDVKAAMEEVVNGTKGGNFLRRVSRMMGPGSGAQTNMLGMGLSSAAGAALGGMTGIPFGAAAGAAIPAIVGSLAGKGATATTLNAAQLASALARSGGKLPQGAERISPIVRALMLGGGGATGGMLAGPQ